MPWLMMGLISVIWPPIWPPLVEDLMVIPGEMVSVPQPGMMLASP